MGLYVSEDLGMTWDLLYGVAFDSTGTPSDVRRAVADLASSWDVGGIVTAAQTMLPDVPWENVAALVEAIRPS